MNREAFFAKWSSLHGDAEVQGIVKSWLTISYALVQPLSRIRTSPHVLTAVGVFAAAGTWINARNWVGIALLVLSLLCDGIDGSLAMVRGVDSQWGAVTDSVADRISEFFWALAFYSLGVSAPLIGVVWLLAGAQEYVRARMAGLGAKSTDVVTIAERPVRASLLFLAMMGWHFNAHIAGVIAAVWLVMQATGFLQVIRDGYVRLK